MIRYIKARNWGSGDAQTVAGQVSEAEFERVRSNCIEGERLSYDMGNGWEGANHGWRQPNLDAIWAAEMKRYGGN